MPGFEVRVALEGVRPRRAVRRPAAGLLWVAGVLVLLAAAALVDADPAASPDAAGQTEASVVVADDADGEPDLALSPGAAQGQLTVGERVSPASAEPPAPSATPPWRSRVARAPPAL